MNEPFNASTDPGGGPTIASSLSTIIDRFGPAVFFKPEEVRLLLRQDCPESNREIDLVLATLAEGVPQRLLAAHGDAAVTRMLGESVDRLTADPAFDRATATRAVRTWAIALALPVADPDRPRPAAAAGAAALSSFASVVTPLAGTRRDEREAAVSPPAAAPVAVPAAAPGPTPIVQPPAPAIPVPIVVRPEPGILSPAPEPVVANAAAASPPAARASFPFKSATAGVALLGVALAAGFLWPRAAVGPTTNPPVVASAPAPKAVASARPEPPPVVPPTKAATEPPPATVTVDAPRRVAPEPPVMSPPPAVARQEVPKAAPTARLPAERPTIARTDAARPPPTRPSPASAAPVAASCTRATCGSVVSVRPLDASATAVELIVRTDDRGIHTVRQSGHWQVGSRVQRIDDRYVAIRAAPASR